MRIAMLVLNDMTRDARVSREAETLASAGHEVTVLCLRSPGLPESEQVRGVDIRRVADQATSSWRHPLRKLVEFSLRERGLREATVRWRPDVVHCHDTPTLKAGVAAAARTGAPVVFDSHELYPDSLMQRPYQRSPLVQGYWRRVERRLVPRVDAVLTVSDPIVDVLRERYGVEAVVVGNMPSLRPPCEGSRLRDELELSDETPVVLYQGAVLPVGRQVVEIVEAVARVPEAVLVVQGEGRGLPAMRARAEDLGISERVRFMGHLPAEELFSYTCGATVGTVFSDGVTLSHKLSWPNRLFMYFMAGVPAVVSELPAMASLVCGERVGVTAGPGDVESMAAAMLYLIEHPEERREMGERARRLAEERFNWEAESRKLLGVYERLEAVRG